MSKFQELREEFRTVFAGRGKLVDAVVPPLLFVIVNAVLGFDYAVWSALALSVVMAIFRLGKKQPLTYALGGLGGVLLAILIAKLLDRAEGYFLPAIITGAMTIILCGISLIARRPLVAWTSYIARRWPLEWYWHPKVRPAYSEVTLVWMLFFVLRLLPQILLFANTQSGILGVIQIATGWPATIALLAASYISGTWRLGRLDGPSVEEFKAGVGPPWHGQRRGF